MALGFSLAAGEGVAHVHDDAVRADVEFRGVGGVYPHFCAGGLVEIVDGWFPSAGGNAFQSQAIIGLVDDGQVSVRQQSVLDERVPECAGWYRRIAARVGYECGQWPLAYPDSAAVRFAFVDLEGQAADHACDEVGDLAQWVAFHAVPVRFRVVGEEWLAGVDDFDVVGGRPVVEQPVVFEVESRHQSASGAIWMKSMRVSGRRIRPSAPVAPVTGSITLASLSSSHPHEYAASRPRQVTVSMRATMRRPMDLRNGWRESMLVPFVRR